MDVAAMLITMLVVLLVAISSDMSPAFAAVASTLPSGIPLSMYVVHSNAVAAGQPTGPVMIQFMKSVCQATV